jgi:hypothetical protein
MEATDTSTVGTLLQVAYTLAALGIAAAAALATRWLVAKAAESAAARAMLTAWELAQSVVAHVEVHLRPTLQGALKDGKLTAAEKITIKAEAVKLLKDALGDKGLAALQKVLGNWAPGVETYLSGLIERALGVQRAAGTLPPPAAPTDEETAAAVRAGIPAGMVPPRP